MKDINDKSNYTGALPVPEDEVHTSDEYDDRRVELQNSVTNVGLALDEADSVQLSKAMFANGVRAQSMLDNSVAANAVELTPISGGSKLRLPTPVAPDYTALNGAIFSFKAANTNIGNMTVNIGQTTGTLIGIKSLFLSDGTTQVPVGKVLSGRYYKIRYDAALAAAAGAFILLDSNIWTPELYTGQESVTYPNGMIIKEGIIARSGTETTVTFASPFPNAITGFRAQDVENGTSTNDSNFIKTYSVSALVIRQAEASVTEFSWYAKGH